MSSAVHHAIADLQRALRLLSVVVLAGAVGALLGEGWLVTQLETPEAHSIALIALLLIGYLALKGYRLYRSIRILRQLRLEHAFVHHAARLAKRTQCLNRRDHLWTHSCILTALQSVAAHPLPRLQLPEEHRQHVAEHFRQGLRPLRSVRLNLDLLLLMLVLGHLATTPLSASGPMLLTLLLGAILLLMVELVQTVLLWRLHTCLLALENALGTWTLHGPFAEALREPMRKPYVHTLLYQARPWFSTTVPVRDAA